MAYLARFTAASNRDLPVERLVLDVSHDRVREHQSGQRRVDVRLVTNIQLRHSRGDRRFGVTQEFGCPQTSARSVSIPYVERGKSHIIPISKVLSSPPNTVATNVLF
jgi:hypothetical protein